MAPAVIATDIRKTFPGDIRALDGLDFTAQFDKVTAIIGANGSGKSTLLQILFGLLGAESGSVQILGMDPAQQSRAFRTDVGYVSQQPALDLEMTGSEILALFYTFYGLNPKKQLNRIEALATDFALTEVLKRRVSTYSGGFRQRLHIAISLLHHPRVLLLDEPFVGLDPESRALLWAKLRDYVEDRRDRALVVATHDLEDVTQHCHQAALLSRGRLCLQDTPQIIIARHGNAILEIRLDQTPSQWETVHQQLLALPSVTQVERSNRRIILGLADSTDKNANIFASLERAGLKVVAYHHQRSNLASAYFKLTGQHAAASVANNRTRKARQRRK